MQILKEKMAHKIRYAISIAIALLIATSCSNKNGETSAENTELSPEDIGLEHASASVLDSMALNADDLSPEQAVSLLAGYTEIYETSSGSRKKAETMRKFVDVYDIVMNNYGDKFRNVIRSYASRDGHVDLKEVSIDYRAKLSGLDEASGAIYDAPAPKDSTEIETEPIETDSIADLQ